MLQARALSYEEPISRARNGVPCPRCAESSRATNSRLRGDLTMRRRECLACGHRFTTNEVVVDEGRAGPLHGRRRIVDSLLRLPPKDFAAVARVIRAMAPE